VPPGEFDLIDRYFRPLTRPAGLARPDVVLGIGDDAALLTRRHRQQLVAALDTLVSGTHFLPGCEARVIGHRALAVNLSDLAAMGALPAWALLALTMPHADEAFLQGFAAGFAALAARHGVALVGGDTTAGPLTVSVQVLGTVPAGQALRRDGASAGDLLFVSGTVGDAAAGLLLERGPEGGVVAAATQQSQADVLRARFAYPEPRIALGLALRGLATACIDVSDGLAADALKLATASGCGLRLETDSLPLSAALQELLGPLRARDLALHGGDDYELCFSVEPGRLAELSQAVEQGGCPVRCIGVLEAQPGLREVVDGVCRDAAAGGYDHFSTGG
jgi:thiamine-monophosphate kinase